MDNRTNRSTITKGVWSRSDYIVNLQNCMEWIRSRRVRVSPHSRYAFYEKVLKKFARDFEAENKSEWTIEETADIINAKLETHELHRIWREFSAHPTEGIDDKLRFLVKGPHHFRDEDNSGGSSAHPRNTGVELSIGAYLQRRGFFVAYGDDSYPEPMVQVNDCEYAIQCKRVTTESTETTIDAMKGAARKIAENVGNYERCRGGFFVFDISKLMNPQGKVLQFQSQFGYVGSEAWQRARQFYENYVTGFPYEDFPDTLGAIVTSSVVSALNPHSDENQFRSSKLIYDKPGTTHLIDALGGGEVAPRGRDTDDVRIEDQRTPW